MSRLLLFPVSIRGFGRGLGLRGRLGAAGLAGLFLLLACGGDEGSGGSNGDAGGSSASVVSTPTVSIPPLDSGVCAPAGSGIAAIERTGERGFSAPPEIVIDTAKSYVATLTTVRGDIVLELAAAGTPITVNSFVFLSCTGYFDGLNFHRYEPGFVIQGGDPRGSGTGGPGYRFVDEFSPDLRHAAAGTLSMANSGPNTNGSQFFITLAPTPHLDDRHSVFGTVQADSMEVVLAIRAGDEIISVSVVER